MPDLHQAGVRQVPIAQLNPAPYNPRVELQPGDPDYDLIKASLEDFGLVDPLVWNERSGHLVGGHQRLNVLRQEFELPPEHELQVMVVDLSPAQERRLNILLNRAQGRWDFPKLLQVVDELPQLLQEGETLGPIGWNTEQLAPLRDRFSEKSSQGDAARQGGGHTLQEQFVVPPFSVLDARQGYWQDRKRAWLELGIRSERGRGEELLTGMSVASHRQGHYKDKDAVGKALGREATADDIRPGDSGPAPFQSAGTSVFDPVLCEIAYRWFCPPGGLVLDPFAGGSVRGIVAAAVGCQYLGLDLSPEQLEENREQWAEIEGKLVNGRPQEPGPKRQVVKDRCALTPIEEHGGWLVKRDDLFEVAGACGGKARTAAALAQGAEGLVTAGARHSPQVAIVAMVAEALGIPCRVHVPTGRFTDQMELAQQAGAEVVQHKPGRNSVLVKRARDDAQESGLRLVPFGMECPEAVEATWSQAAHLPWGKFDRIVVPVGSGMTLAGVLQAVAQQERAPTPKVLGVVVGADPTKRLQRYAPENWQELVELVRSDLRYEQEAPETHLAELELDPVYEAKVLPYLQRGDLLWVVGKRPRLARQELHTPTWQHADCLEAMQEWAKEGPRADFLFTCPPYYNLEQYTEDERDLSRAGSYKQFLAAYRQVIAAAVALLHDNRFACWVVSDIRDSRGQYRGLLADTVRAFHAAGARLYNDAVLATPPGSAPIRAGRHFRGSRKLVRCHQNVLVFVKGDPRKAPLAEPTGTHSHGAEQEAVQGS